MSHKAVTFFQAMGFNSDFKDSTASPRLVATCGHFQVKLVAEYMQALQDSMWGKS